MVKKSNKENIMPTHKIKEFNKTNLQTLRKEFEEALSKVGWEYGIELSLGRFNYQTETFRFKVDVNIEGAKSQEELNLDFYTHYKKGDEIKVIGLDGSAIVQGFNTKKRKYPLMVENNGKTYGLVYSKYDEDKQYPLVS